jgi:dihydrofolate synthase/folylpolyglutamate synthase
MTAIGFQYFVEQEVDLAVVETGLGGRLDSTNVLKPEVCAITSISYDHVNQLGHSLAQIAEEKAGIFKPGVPAVSSPQAPEVRDVLMRVAEKVKTPLRFTGKDIEFSYRFESSRASGPQTRVSLTTPTTRFEHLPVPLPGDHQAINCGLALSVMSILKERGFAIEDQKAIEGLAKAHLPGRMEVIHQDPRIMVDGAHNAASVEALMRAIGQNVTYDSMVVIFACRTDKDIPGMLDHVQLGADKVIFTTTGSPRSADPAELAAQYVERSGKMAQVAGRLEDALDIAERAVTREDLICVTGSFYLVGRAKQVVAGRYAKEAKLRIA